MSDVSIVPDVTDVTIPDVTDVTIPDGKRLISESGTSGSPHGSKVSAVEGAGAAGVGGGEGGTETLLYSQEDLLSTASGSGKQHYRVKAVFCFSSTEREIQGGR